MSDSNVMTRSDADKNVTGAKMLVIDSVGDLGQIHLGIKIFAAGLIDCTTTPPTIMGGYNISSVARAATGKFIGTFASDLPSSVYGIVVVPGNTVVGSSGVMLAEAADWLQARSAHQFAFATIDSGAWANLNRVTVMIIGW